MCSSDLLGTMATQASTSYVAKSGDTMTGQLRVPAGTISAPGLAGANGLNGVSIGRFGDNAVELISNGQVLLRCDGPGGSNNTQFLAPVNLGSNRNVYCSWDTTPITAAGYCAAWVNFNGTSQTNFSGTYSASGTTCTATVTNHGLDVGQQIYVTFTGGPLATSPGPIAVATVASANQFTFTLGSSQTGTGTIGFAKAPIRASGNVTSVNRVNIGDYQINFANPMPDANYAVTGCGQYDITSANTNAPMFGVQRVPGAITANAVRVCTLIAGQTVGYDCLQVHVAIFR